MLYKKLMFKPLIENPKARAKYIILDNSVTVHMNGLITAGTTTANERTKYAIPVSTTSQKILGVIIGYGKGEGGVPVEVSKMSASSLTTPSDNITGDKYGVWYIPASDRNVEYEADLDAAAGTTAGSSGMGYFNIADDETLDESTYAVATGTVGQFFSYGLADGETQKVKVRIEKYL